MLSVFFGFKRSAFVIQYEQSKQEPAANVKTSEAIEEQGEIPPQQDFSCRHRVEKQLSSTITGSSAFFGVNMCVWAQPLGSWLAVFFIFLSVLIPLL